MGWTDPDRVDDAIDRLLNRLAHGSQRCPSDELSPAEDRVLRGLSHGLTSEMIAVIWGLSPETVKSESKSLRRKLGAKNTCHAVAIALRDGLIQ